MESNPSILLSLLVILLVCLILFDVIIPIFYLRYINKLKKNNCKCSQGFNRTFIMGYSIYVYISVIALVVASFMLPYKQIEQILETPTRIVISTGLAFLIGYSLYQYQKKVYADSCECAIQTWEPKVMRIHSYIIGVLVLISMLNILTLLGGRKIKNKSAVQKSISQLIRKNNL